MIRFFYSILMVGVLCISSLDAQEADVQDISLIPYPESLVVGEGRFLFTNKTVVILEDEGMMPVVSDFVQLFSTAAGFVPKIKLEGKKGDVFVKKDEMMPEEGYVLEVTPERIMIKVSNSRGLYYAFQTLRQLLPLEIEGGDEKSGIAWSVPTVTVTDAPRFSYRGLMVDVARYFIPKEHLFRIIDNMGMLKMNKLHLHLTDNNGWRLEIKQYPLLTEIGSKQVQRQGKMFPERRNARQGEPLVDGGFYTQEEMKEIIAYAEKRQIEVIPEIAIPGHSNAALASYPTLACPVIDKYIGAVPGLGADHTRFVYCAGNEEVFTFLERIIDEIVELFPSKYIHLGGDAVRDTYWKDCPLCRERMKKERLDDEGGLLCYFMHRVDRYVRSKGRTVMGWEEVMDAHLSKGAVVFDWHGFGHGAVKAAKQGHRFVMAPVGTMYLNTYQGPQWSERIFSFGGVNTLKNIYHYDPIERYWTMSMRSNLLGVQASLWTEFCEKPEDVDYLLFPRLAAVAEAVWSVPMVKRWERFLNTLDNYWDRWMLKGIRPSMSMYNVTHEVVPDFGELKVTLSCIRPDVEIRYTVNGKDPDDHAAVYRRPFAVNEDVEIRCATFRRGRQVGETLVLPIKMNEVTGKNLLRSNAVEKRLVNGVRGSMKNTDGEWASWTKNDSIALTFDMGNRRKMKRMVLGCLNDYGLAIHKPEKIEVWLSDNDMLYWKMADRRFDENEIFKEGRFVEDLSFVLDDAARYVRVIMKGVGNCPSYHVRSGMEAQIFIDEVQIE